MFKAKTRACLLLGGNIGAVKERFDQTELLLQKELKILKRSGDYCSEPWGMESAHDFVNRALLVETDLEAPALLRFMLKTERSLGRERSVEEGYQDRPIDIDLLFFGQEVRAESGLTLPHPKLAERKFALLPLKEVAADWCHPLTKQNASEMLKQLKDDLRVEICS